jgi:hypothetical protein
VAVEVVGQIVVVVAVLVVIGQVLELQVAELVLNLL